MGEERGEGIVLKSTDYKESNRILSIFTPHAGVINVIVKRISKKKTTLINLTSPLCRAEFVYRKGRSQLYSFIDGTILDLHLPLRHSYKHLQTAGNMLRAIATTQYPEKPVPILYYLLLSYLKKLPTFSKPKVLFASFKLKLLKHEGLLSITEICNHCQKRSARTLVEGESLCLTCAPHGSYPFSKEEWKALLVLFEARTFEAFLPLSLSDSLQKGIDICFQTS